MTIRRALLSVYDKTGVAAVRARARSELGVELLASGGTAQALADEGIPGDAARGADGLRRAARPPGRDAPSGGARRHPRAPRRARRPRRARGSRDPPIDLVCVNLYPFERTVGRLDVAWEEAIEQIDVGGPAMLRAAAKNHAHVVPVCRPEDYEPVLEEYRVNGRRVARDAARARRPRLRRRRPRYDAAVARWFGREEHFPETFVPVFDRVLELAYGENPHQRAAYYAQRGCAHAPARTGRPDAGQAALVQQPRRPLGRAAACRASSRAPAAVIVKHANPCGVALGATIEEAYAEGACGRPGLGLRRGRRRSTGRSAPSSGARSPSSSSRSCSRRGTTTRRSRRLAGKPTRVLADSERRASSRASATCGACSAGCSSRTATPTATRSTRWTSSAATPTQASGRTSSSPGRSSST